MGEVTDILQLKVRLLGISPTSLFQTRTRTLDGTLRATFEQWYPDLKQIEKTPMAA